MKFLIDTVLPTRLAKFLSNKGFDAVHTSCFSDGYLFDEAIRRTAKGPPKSKIA